MLLKFSKIRNVESPKRGHATDAGIDFKCPEFDNQFKSDLLNKSGNQGLEIKDDGIIILPGMNACIPSGIKVEIPYGYMGLFLNKSGVASKDDMIVGAQVVDTFYSGEVHVDLHNISNIPYVIRSGMKLAQMVLVPILCCDLTEVDENQLYDWMLKNENRGSDGFGSTGK